MYTELQMIGYVIAAIFITLLVTATWDTLWAYRKRRKNRKSLEVNSGVFGDHYIALYNDDYIFIYIRDLYGDIYERMRIPMELKHEFTLLITSLADQIKDVGEENDKDVPYADWYEIVKR